MGWINKKVILLFILFYLLCICSFSIDFQATEFEKVDPEFRRSLEPPPAPGPSQASLAAKTTEKDYSESTRMTINEQMNLNYYQTSQFPIAVNKYVLYHSINRNYSDDTICILIQATNIVDKTLENIDVYEIAPYDIKIINCSVPVKASSIDETLRYMRRGDRLLSGEDILNPVSLGDKLKINKHPSNLKINFSMNDSFNTSKAILKRLNEIITNTELDNQTAYIDQRYLWTQTRKLLNLSRDHNLLKIDRQILNFLIIRDLYPSHIRKPEGYIEIIENFNVEEEAGLIHIRISKMRPKESLMFIYHANTSSHESQKTTAIIDISGETYPNLLIPLDVAFPSPKFNVRGDYSKQKVQPGDPITIKYIIQLLNPANRSSEYSFSAHVGNNDSNITIVQGPYLTLNFSDENYLCEQTITIEIDESGKYNIPSLSIDNTSEYFVIDEQIEVEPLWHFYILEITIMFLAFCTLIGSNFKELKKQHNWRYRIGLACLLLMIIWITCSLCKWSSDYGIISSIITGFIIFYWMYRSP